MQTNLDIILLCLEYTGTPITVDEIVKISRQVQICERPLLTSCARTTLTKWSKGINPTIMVHRGSYPLRYSKASPK